MGKAAHLTAQVEENSIAKVIQSHREVSALFATADNDYCMVRCKLPQPLQVMASTKQEVYNLCVHVGAETCH